jgi:hypothetical protein
MATSFLSSSLLEKKLEKKTTHCYRCLLPLWCCWEQGDDNLLSSPSSFFFFLEKNKTTAMAVIFFFGVLL